MLSQKLQLWYAQNHRDLPWRHTQDAYRIWVSEIILQQTRVAQGMEYYLRFLHRFPELRALAEAEETEVLRVWQGLGYYSRARNMHKAAKEVMERFQGAFPQNYEALLSLPGIGTYTAAAISSFSADEARATVDGNVYRVLARFFNIHTPIDSTAGHKYFQELATEILDKLHPALHNQALMEFGALQCTPGKPDCKTCPLANHCAGQGEAENLPVKQGHPRQKERWFNYVDLRWGKECFLQVRQAGDIWQGLYEFYLIEQAHPCNLPELLCDPLLRNCRCLQEVGHYTHQLSHQIIHACFLRAELLPTQTSCLPPTLLRIPQEQLGDYPMSRLMEKYLQRTT